MNLFHENLKFHCVMCYCIIDTVSANTVFQKGGGGKKNMSE